MLGNRLFYHEFHFELVKETVQIFMEKKLWVEWDTMEAAFKASRSLVFASSLRKRKTGKKARMQVWPDTSPGHALYELPPS